MAGKRSSVLVVGLALVAALAMVANAAGPKTSAPAAATEVQVPAGDLKWQPIQGAPPGGPLVAFVRGDPKTGPVAGYLKVSSGYRSGLHRHPSDYQAVVVEGTVANPVEHRAAKELTKGSYWFQPSTQAHETNCVSKEDCVFFFAMPGPMGMIPVEEPKHP